jgi:hypothetical protein
MPTLRADENRYLFAAEGREAALAARIPGARPNALHHALQLPRQPGVILALDDLFGPEGWDCSAELSIELADARGRVHAEPQQPATLDLVNGEFAIECAFADKELVKLVPGYRWSAPNRRWFTPAAPMALDLLIRRFGDLLEVSEDATTFAELRRADQEAFLARTGVAPTAFALATPTGTITPALPHAPDGPGPEPALNDQIARLTAAVESLEETMRTLVARLEGPPLPVGAVVATPTSAPVPQGIEPGIASEWRDLLARAPIEPAETFAAASRLLQTAPPESERPLREVMGIAAALNGDHATALTYLRRALDPAQPAVDPDLRREAVAAYVQSVLALVSAECGPERPIGSGVVFEELLLEELIADQGFKDSVLASRPSQDRLDYLVNDPVLRHVAHRLSDCCRTAHLVGISKGGAWMAVERIIDVLRDPDLGDDGFAFGLIVLANNLHQAASVSEWEYRWPNDAAAGEDLAWLAPAAERRLLGVDGRLATYAAVSCLACIATGPAEWATTAQRRSLVQLVPPKATIRRYAEFLAGFRLATEAPKTVLTQFQGYLQVLAQCPLSTTAPHLVEVFMHDSGGPGSISRAIAESVVVDAIAALGVEEPDAEVMDLLDMLAESPRADNLMNRLARMVEDAEFRGAELFTRAQRKQLYGRALAVSRKAGHDGDSVEAFDRLVRELRDEGASEEVRSLCLGLQAGPKALRLAAASVLLGLLLEAGEPFEEAAETLRKAHGDETRETLAELAGLALLFPVLNEYLPAHAVEGPAKPDADFSGKRIVIVGGHQWLQKHAMPVMEERWKLGVTWVDPDAARNGDRALDLAAGTADLIVVNTACIGHAASGRVRQEAKKWGEESKPFLLQNGRGVGSLLSFVKTALERGATAPEPKRPSKLSDKRRLVR